MTSYRIINMEGAELPFFIFDNTLVDTWYLSSYNHLYEIDIDYNMFHDVLKRSRSIIYNIAKENSKTWNYNNVMYCRVKKYKKGIYVFKKLAEKLKLTQISSLITRRNNIYEKHSFECDDVFLESTKAEELTIIGVNLYLDMNINVYDNCGNITREWAKCINIAIYDNKKGEFGSTIDIYCDGFGRIFYPDNRFDIMMIDLIDKGFIHVDNEADWDEVVRFLMPYVDIGDLEEIAQKVKAIGPVYITIDDYEVYKSYVIKFREDDYKLRDNRELSRLNRDLIENELVYPLAEQLGGEVRCKIKENI